MDFNKVILGGRLTRNPELRYIPSGAGVCEFGLAINRKRGGKEEVMFVDVTAWDKTAEIICKYLKKGREILVEGRLQMDTWRDRNGGGTRSKLKVVVETFQFVGGPDKATVPSPDAGQPPLAETSVDDIPY